MYFGLNLFLGSVYVHPLREKLWQKTTFLLRWQRKYTERVWLARLCRPYDRTAFEALPVVLCTKGPMYKKLVDTSLHPSTSWV